MTNVSFKKEEPENMQFNVKKNFFCNYKKSLNFPYPRREEKNTSAFIRGKMINLELCKKF